MARRNYGKFTPKRRAALRRAQRISAQKRKGHFSRNKGKYIAGGVAVGVLAATTATAHQLGYRIQANNEKVALTKNVKIRTGSEGPLFSRGAAKFVPGKREIFGLKLNGGSPTKAGRKLPRHFIGDYEVSGQREGKTYYKVSHLYGVKLKGSVGPTKARRRRATPGLKPVLKFNEHGFVVGRH